MKTKKYAIIIGNGINRQFKDFSNLNILIKKRVYNTIKKIKKINLDYANKMEKLTKYINWEEPNFEKAFNEYDQMLDKLFSKISLSNEKPKNESWKMVQNGNIDDKTIISYLKSMQIIQMPETILKTIYQLSILEALFIDLKINEINYPKNFNNKFLQYFQQIFTTNYDENLEKLGLNIIHLHGEISKNFVSEKKKQKNCIDKIWKTTNLIGNYLAKNHKYFYSNALIESNSKRKKITLSKFSKLTNINNEINQNRKIQYENNYSKLLDFKKIFIYGLNIQHDIGLVEYLKKNNKKIYYFYRNEEDLQKVISFNLESYIPNPLIMKDK